MSLTDRNVPDAKGAVRCLRILRRALLRIFGSPPAPQPPAPPESTRVDPKLFEGGFKEAHPGATPNDKPPFKEKRPTTAAKVDAGPKDAGVVNLLTGEDWLRVVRVLYSGRASANMKVGTSLALSGLRLRSLPPGLTIKGDLDLRQCERLRRIGDGLQVEGNLWIGGKGGGETARLELSTSERGMLSQDPQVPLRALPEGLRVGGSLFLSGCALLERLPDDFSIGHSIDLRGCRALRELPEGLTVRGDLALVGARTLRSLPRNLTVRGDLVLDGLPIERLPEGLTLHGSLRLQHCPHLRSFPAELEVPGDLTIIGCPIEALPLLRVGRTLRLAKMPRLREIGEKSLVIGDSLVGRSCQALERVRAGLELGRDLLLVRCRKLRELPENLHIPGRLLLHDCSTLACLPAGLRVSHRGAPGRRRQWPRGSGIAVELQGCTALTALPDDLVVEGFIELAGSGARTVGKRPAADGYLVWRGVRIQPDVLKPETLTPERILTEPNSEVRRTMIERVGLRNLLARLALEIVDEDTDPGGPRRLLRLKGAPEVPDRVFLHCRCPSSGREYLVRVPPDVRRCHDAAAWMAGFNNPQNYHPHKET